MPDLLRVDRVNRSFGGVHAVKDASLRWAEGTVHGLIGPNGAGKSTLLNIISGMCRPDSGSVALNDRSIVGKRPWQIARAGIARTFQTTLLDEHASVLENVAVGGHVAFAYGPPWGLLPSRRARRVESKLLARAEETLEQLGLAHLADVVAADLPYGTRRLVEVARACLTSPKLLLLDEPAAGLPHQEALLLGTQLNGLASDTGMSVVLVEHNVQLVMSVCEQITVLVEGSVAESGSPTEVANSTVVVESYLGVRATSEVRDA